MNEPRGDQTGFESFRPDSVLTSGLTNKGSISSTFLSVTAGADGESSAIPAGAMNDKKRRAQPRVL
jgi:hypothetical protein